MRWSVVVLCLVLAGCGDPAYEKGGTSYAAISADRNNRCRVMVSDMGRSNPAVRPFSAIIEGCKQ